VWKCGIVLRIQPTCKKLFPNPSLDVTNQTLPGRELLKNIPGQESLVSDIPVGDGKNDNLFFTVYSHFAYLSLNLKLKKMDAQFCKQEEIELCKKRVIAGKG
jgi:hypothetical protein